MSKPVKCKWTSLTKSCIKILGIHFSFNKALAEKENFYNLSLDCRTLLNIWKQRWLSLAGKIQYHMKLVASPLCLLCKGEVETISRLFLRCEFSTRLWAETRKWSSHTITLPQLSEKIVYLGWFSDDLQTILINHILLLYKYFLYSRRNDRGKINFSAFKLYIRYVVKTEESIAKWKKNLTAHLSKWDPLMVLFP